MKNKNHTKSFAIRRASAFTLIEILVLVGIIMLIILSIGGLMSGVFKSQNKNSANDRINQSGNWVLNELRKNILSANSNSEDGLKFTCPIGIGDSIKITSLKDGGITTLSCVNDKIASISARGEVTLFNKNKDLKLVDCDNFVSCSTLPSLQLSKVSFNFTLKAGDENLSSGTSRTFLMDVTLRN